MIACLHLDFGLYIYSTWIDIVEGELKCVAGVHVLLYGYVPCVVEHTLDDFVIAIIGWYCVCTDVFVLYI